MDRAGGSGLAMLAVSLLGAAYPAGAQDIQVSATASVTSDYRFRGISQSGRDPALQATIDLDTPGGLFAGAFASTVDGEALGGADGELDLYAGYQVRSGSFSYSLSGFGYFYPGGHDVSYGEVQGEIGYLIGPAQAKLYAAYAPDQRNTGSDNVYLGASVSGGIPLTPLSVALRGGYEDGFYTGKWDWQAELSYVRGPFTVSAAYVDTDQDGRAPLGKLGSAGGVATLSVAF